MASKRDKQRTARLEGMPGPSRLLHVMQLQGHMLTWGQALDRQAGRIANGGLLERYPDAFLYASALGSALRCAGLAELLGVDLSSAKSTFDAAVPYGMELRNVVEHLEDHEIGIGNHSAKPWESSPDFGMIWSLAPGVDHGRLDYSVRVQGTDVRGSNIEFSFTEAHVAARAYFTAVLDGLHDLRAALEAEHGPWKPPPRPDLTIIDDRPV
jgi:hypothetical protein